MSEPVFIGAPTDVELTDQLLSPVWTPRRRTFVLGLVLCFAGTCAFIGFIAYTVMVGIGAWGNNIPVGWAFGITNFVWWIGIGHAGTFISAILLLFEQKWRTSINRFAEAMTLFAVMQAGLFPLLHLGRPWFAYWLVPYPSTMGVWPNFKSALPWDVAAVTTYFTVSLLFWYLGLLPDLATLRDRAPKRWQRIVYGLLSLGWRGSARHYRHYQLVYGLFAGLATPLVLSVHSVVSSDFAITILPGWHSTIFPPYFVAGAIFSGFCMVLTLLVPIRRVFNLQNVITLKHVDNVCKMILLTGLIVDYSYLVEFFISWYSGEPADMWTMLRGLPTGPNCWAFWYTIFSNVFLVQLFWIKQVRFNLLAVWVLSLAINFGMWTERYSIIALSLQQDFLPSSWAAFHPRLTDFGLLFGSMACFAFLFLLFLRWLPFIPLAELKELKSKLTRGKH